MAACFQQKTGDSQESGFHSRAEKGFFFNGSDLSTYFSHICSCLLLPCSSTSAPFSCIMLCSYSNLFSSPSLHCSYLLSQTVLVSPLGCLFEIPVPFFLHVQGVSLPSKAQFSFHSHESFVSPFSLLIWLPNLATLFLQFNINVFHFLSPLLLIPLSLPRYLYLKVSCLTASFTFHL